MASLVLILTVQWDFYGMETVEMRPSHILQNLLASILYWNINPSWPTCIKCSQCWQAISKQSKHWVCVVLLDRLTFDDCPLVMGIVVFLICRHISLVLHKLKHGDFIQGQPNASSWWTHPPSPSRIPSVASQALPESAPVAGVLAPWQSWTTYSAQVAEEAQEWSRSSIAHPGNSPT